MANEYAVNQADLKAVADAIRTKGSTSDALTFPDGFIDAVGAIATGGGMDMDVGEIMLETSNLVLVIPTTKKRKYVAIFLDGNPLALGLSPYSVFAGMAYAGTDSVVGYGGNFYISYNGSINSGGAREVGEDLGPVFNDDNIRMPQKVAGTNSNAWVAGVTYKYLAWG
jgi:hypothetical protein